MAACPTCGAENDEQARFCSSCAALLAAQTARSVRKTVTVVFCDLVGSTSLGDGSDPELLRDVMSRYHAELRTIVERHGGTVEKFVGDAAMAVFGIPLLHEDDALRAVRSAVEMREAVSRLGLEVRIGVNSGEVVAGGGETLVTGDAVNVAARLQQAAAPAEILLGLGTDVLVQQAVRTEGVEPLALKGKAERVEASRLVELLPDVPAFTRPIDSAFVGRQQELGVLERALATATETRSAQLATVVGPGGVGKSRLVRELIGRAEASVLIGRCLSYGDGITYWPLAEIVSQVGETGSVVDDPLVGERIEAAVGAGTATAEEIAWGFRMLFEGLARRRTLIVVVDDIHWAEPRLLDLIEYVATFAQDAPLFLLCTARPELLEDRPAWAAPRQGAVLQVLGPLADEDSETLIETLGEFPAEVRARIVEAAEGNPLFLEQLVAMRADHGSSELEIPPTVQALLAARIDHLGPGERAVIERASVEGRAFHRGAVAELLPEEARSQVGSHLLTLIRKEFIRPDRATVPGDDGFRFGHILIRDAAYDSIPKRVRAELHEHFAAWLADRLGTDAPDEILGYHLEQAYRYGSELGSPDDAIGARAAAHLVAAGQRALARHDSPAVVNLLQRALALDDVENRAAVELRLASALVDLGRMSEAGAAARASGRAAAEAGDRPGELKAALFRGQIAAWTAPDPELLPLAQEALAMFEAAGDALGSIEAWRVIALEALERGAADEAIDAFGQAIVCAQRIDHPDQYELLGWQMYAMLHGPTPVGELLHWVEHLGSPVDELEPIVLALYGDALAMDGRIDRGRELMARAGERIRELGLDLWEMSWTEFAWSVETTAGDFAEAERVARHGTALYQRLEIPNVGLGMLAGMLAQALCAQGRYDEAAEATELASGNALSLTPALVAWQHVRAKVLAHRGELTEAVQAARAAVEQLEQTDLTRWQADAWLDLGEVLALAGDQAGAVDATRRALQRYEGKGIVPLAERTRTLLASREAGTGLVERA